MSFLTKLMNPLKYWLWLSLLAIVIPLAGLAWFGYESYSSGFSAKGTPSAIEIWLARQVRSFAIPTSIKEAPNPIPPSPGILVEGLEHFADHCAICHANDGSGKTPIGENVYPPAPDLRKNPTQSMSDGELFFAIHNGIRFTAMPAWGKGTPKDEAESWLLVHFIRHLPDLTPEELTKMKTLNPVSPHELSQEKEFENFLLGEDGGKTLLSFPLTGKAGRVSPFLVRSLPCQHERSRLSHSRASFSL